jgi:hypothetical protein
MTFSIRHRPHPESGPPQGPFCLGMMLVGFGMTYISDNIP